MEASSLRGKYCQKENCYQPLSLETGEPGTPIFYDMETLQCKKNLENKFSHDSEIHKYQDLLKSKKYFGIFIQNRKLLFVS